MVCNRGRQGRWCVIEGGREILKSILAFGIACCLSIQVDGQFFGGNRFTSLRKKPNVCEASGAAEIVRPDQFISNKYTVEEWQEIIHNITITNEAEWNKLQTFEEYYYPEAYYEYENYGNFECKDVCRSKRRRVEGALLDISDVDPETGVETKMTFDCYIIGNPNIFYTDCRGKRPDVHRRRFLSSSFQCMSDMLQYREVIMYCPDVAPQCRTRVLELPQSCSLNEIQCKLPKRKKPRRRGRGRFGKK
ncbi:hypothetical protein FSP39_023584 [Pinctada imbricata]|uniref:Uncharacterized protein n=1 Tax=Pinctada imbricata TaxID=66713 RepID=A0AA88Y1A4_PINIB|nr:hypothetical protein FSP39_023584 [Pinctada imbricata]